MTRFRILAAPQAARLALVALLVAAAVGCTAHRHYREGEIAAQLGNWDEAVLQYMEALAADPGNLSYRSALLRARIQASREHFERGKQYKEAGVWERALVEFQQAVQLDPTNQYAEAELAAARQRIEAVRQGITPDSLAELKRRTSGARPQPPVLDPRSDEPISLDFPEPTPIFQIYKALGDAFGINVLFDQNLRDQEITVTLQEVTAQTALETLMRAAGHFYKVLDEHTVLIAADTPQNRKVYEDLVIQTFFLSNAEVKDMMTILRSLIDSRRVAPNDQLNAIIIRDTADKVKVAERIIQANDKARAEVVVDVELLQIDTTRMREIGTQLSQYSVTQSLDLGSEDAVLRVSDLEFLNQSNWALTIPNFIYNFVKRSSDAQLLAQPQLRSSEGEKARAVIGDQVPIPVTSFNTANTVGSNIVPVTSFQYRDVGITIEIEPRVHHNQEITLKMRVEVSNISGFVSGPGGQQQPRIGTRTIESTIRLRDGETNLIAGLIRTDESSGEQGLPGLSDLPVIGHLFGSKLNDRSRTDLILTLTPHIIRQAEITEEDLLPIWVGTEQNITFRGGSPRLESDSEGPFDGAGTAEEMEELMRQRLERLPPGLREGQQAEEGQPEPPAGVDLVPQPIDEPSPFDEPEEEFEEPLVDDPEALQVDPDSVSYLDPGLDPALDLGLDGGAEETSAGPGWVTVAAAIAAAERETAEVDAGRPETGWSLASLAGGSGGAGSPAAGEARPDGAAAGSDLVPGRTGGRDAAARVWLAPAAAEVRPGQTFELRLQAAAARPLSHLPLTLEYDPALLAVERVETGRFLGPSGEAQLLSDATRPGRIVVGASRLGKVPGVRGEGTVATITFRALAAGTAAVAVTEGRALDTLLRPLTPFAAAGAEVRIGGGSGSEPAPEPPRRERPALRPDRAAEESGPVT